MGLILRELESSTTFTMNTITNGYNYIQTINHRRAILVLSIMQKMHITFFFKFTFFKRIINVTCNYGLILLKQLCHLSLCQPHGLILQPDINLRLSIWSLIDYNLLIFLHTLFVLTMLRFSEGHDTCVTKGRFFCYTHPFYCFIQSRYNKRTVPLLYSLTHRRCRSILGHVQVLRR